MHLMSRKQCFDSHQFTLITVPIAVCPVPAPPCTVARPWCEIEPNVERSSLARMRLAHLVDVLGSNMSLQVNVLAECIDKLSVQTLTLLAQVMALLKMLTEVRILTEIIRNIIVVSCIHAPTFVCCCFIL